MLLLTIFRSHLQYTAALFVALFVQLLFNLLVAILVLLLPWLSFCVLIYIVHLITFLLVFRFIHHQHPLSVDVLASHPCISLVFLQWVLALLWFLIIFRVVMLFLILVMHLFLSSSLLLSPVFFVGCFSFVLSFISHINLTVIHWQVILWLVLVQFSLPLFLSLSRYLLLP